MLLILLPFMEFQSSLCCSETLFLALPRLIHFAGAIPWNWCVHLSDLCVMLIN